MKYRRLALRERYQIQALLDSGAGPRRIGVILGRSASTISREIRLNSRSGVFYPKLGHDYALARRRSSRPVCRKIRGNVERVVRERLNERWSPEQISGRMRLKWGSHESVSTSTIYRYVARRSLQNCLRRKGKKSKETFVQRRIPIPGKKMISERPTEVDQRERIGDYERDLMRGKTNHPALFVIVDRTSRRVKATMVQKNAERVHRATLKLLKNEPVMSVTNDNGSEFAEHQRTSEAIEAPVYFSHPYCSWEKGSVENLNGLIREYLPRRRHFGEVTELEVAKICQALNHRPRKCLGYKTPEEVYAEGNGQMLR